MPWLTHDTPLPALIARVVYLPDSPEVLSDFFGAFLKLAKEENWEKFGSATPEEMAAYWLEAYEQSNQG